MAGGSAGDKTEKATPKRREEARKEGQVARSMEVNSALAMFAGFSIMLVFGPRMWNTLSTEMRMAFTERADDELTIDTAMDIFFHNAQIVLESTWPFLIGMALVGIIANLLQIKFKVTPEVIKPRLSKINPINGAKQKFGPQALVELLKNVLKLIVVGAPAFWVLWRERDRILSLGFSEPIVAALLAASMIVKIGFVISAIYVFIAILDYIWQRHRHEKQMKMTKQEVKQEMRQQDIAPEIKSQQRRRQREAARRRMLSDVPTADVIITNPTHFAVALKYDPDDGAPKVVAKGTDLLAKRIREIAADAGVMRVENKPLARALYAQVDVGQYIPGELFAAVAEILAYVYRSQKDKQREWGEAAGNRAGVAALEHA